MILYFGNDQNFKDRMEAYYATNPIFCDVITQKEEFLAKNVIDKMIALNPLAMVFDFANPVDGLKGLFFELNYLRKSKKYRGIPIIGIFSNKDDITESRFLFAMGLNYPFIRGCDEKILFTDIHYLIHESESPFAMYATAKLNSLPYKGKQLAHVYGYTKSSVLIESDMPQTEGDLRNVELLLIGNEKTLDLRVQNHFENGITCSFLGRSEFEIPFIGPWDDPESDLIHKDSYETWIDDSEDELNAKAGRILLASSNPEDFSLAGKLALQCNFDIYVSETFEDSKSYMEAYNFDVIYYRLDKEGEAQENNFDNLFRLTNCVKNLHSTESIFVAFNSPSKSNALKKGLDYDHIVAIDGDVTEEYLLKFTKLFEDKGNKIGCESMCYNPSNNNAEASFLVDMNISSINEHELTFYSSEVIPMYSLLRIDVPTDLYLLIVPPYKPLENVKDGKHYMGFIVGGKEQDSELIRSFVNRAVVKGLTEFCAYGDEEELADNAEEQPDTTTEHVDESVAVKTTTDKSRKKIERKTNYNGKSKL